MINPQEFYTNLIKLNDRNDPWYKKLYQEAYEKHSEYINLRLKRNNRYGILLMDNPTDHYCDSYDLGYARLPARNKVIEELKSMGYYVDYSPGWVYAKVNIRLKPNLREKFWRWYDSLRQR